jgi:hypothetical protein
VRLVAKVRRVTGRGEDWLARMEEDGAVVRQCRLPPAERVEIAEQEDGVFLFRYDTRGEWCGESWHLTVEEAKRQAEAEFEIPEDAWELLEE